ncbi:MAG: formylglycine-generating enzyme family protein [Odoribacteraceae bacterium]|jgi:formylglycine-generating enzyme required for sulfatase activity|nr:formylglycine-generating enzyme family protein [Odoribacteraceae bacterium]
MKTKFLTIAAVAAFAILATSGGQANAQRHPAEPEMVLVQGGTFRMGGVDVEGTEDESEDELPVHEVTISSFYMGKFEVTQVQWEALMDNKPSNFKGDHLPVEQVSWNDVQLFIKRLNAATGKQYRLPTEAEWEYAARGGNQSKGYRYAGGNAAENIAWVEDNSGDRTHPVGTKQPNELGIHDMNGNVWEWCHDFYGPYPASAQQDPRGASSGPARVFRGNSWSGAGVYCRVAFRRRSLPEYGYNFLGFRLACSPE